MGPYSMRRKLDLPHSALLKQKYNAVIRYVLNVNMWLQSLDCQLLQKNMPRIGLQGE